MKKFKAIVKIAVTIGIVAVVAIAILQMRSRQCKEMKVRIDREIENPLVSTGDIDRLLRDSGIVVVGKNFKEITSISGKLLQLVERHPFVQSCDKVFFAGSTLVFDITPREPLIRIYPSGGEQYFLDKKGHTLPYSERVKENLVIANGNHIPRYKGEKQADSVPVLKSIFTIGSQICENEFSSAQFRQIYINEGGDVELIPTIGNHIVLFGDHENTPEKLFHLEETYKKALSYMGMEQYASLDVRFKNRVIARKK